MTASGDSPRGLRRTFQSLGSRNYRLFFFGQIVSSSGTWMQKVAQDWLIIELGGGPLQLSIGVALQSLPYLFLGPWGGALIDRTNVRALLLTTQALLASLALLLGLLVISGHIEIWVVYLLGLFGGCIGVLDSPARQALVLDMVGHDRVANAVSLNSSIHNASRLIGPAIAGVLIAAAGTGVAFLVNAATFSAIIVALLRIDSSSLIARPRVQRARGQIREGFRYCWRVPDIRSLLIATLIVSTLSQNFRILLPLFVTDVFGGEATGYGLLLSALGVGALGGALVCAHLARPSMTMVRRQSLYFGAVMVVAAISPTYAVLVAAMLAVGVGNTSFNTSSNSLLLLNSDPEFRGRVLSMRSLVSNGSTPIGSLVIGFVCHVAGPRIGMLLGAAAALVAYVTLRDPLGAVGGGRHLGSWKARRWAVRRQSVQGSSTGDV